jgi:hypothetical protein
MHDIDLDDTNWKQAAAQEAVDYQAVESTFMTQAYGFVANKAKVLFRDPFRLGFEIVHRNEKATKMVGIFAFRCNNSLLYAPVFFVNGEIKGADMLYRSEVKRFVPLTDEWCSFLVRGANEETGVLQRRDSIRRQVDAHMYRLAYPQRVKYASTEDLDPELQKLASSDIFNELMAHCAQDDAPPARLLPRAIQDGGPDFLVKLANLIENSEIASRFVAENYTKDDLTLDPEWCVKKAAEAAAKIDPMDRFRGSVILVRELGLAKSAADRKGIAERGYAMEDYRELGAVNATIDVAEDPVIHELASPGVVSVMDTEGGQFDALLLLPDEKWMNNRSNSIGGMPTPEDYGQRILITLDGKPSEYLSYHGRRNDRLIGSYKEDKTVLDKCLVKPSSAKVGKAYVLVHRDSLQVSEPFVVAEKRGKAFATTSLYGGDRADLVFKQDADSADPNRGYVNDEFALIEIKTEAEEGHGNPYHKTVWKRSMMAPAALNAWLRTCGGSTHSKDITILKEPSGLFTISADGSDGFRKVARSLDRMAAHLSLVGDYEMRVDKSGEILDFAEDKGTHRFRLFDTVTKSGYVTRMNPEQEWVTGFDPVLNSTLQFPQQQTVGTYTPERPQQHHRLGDRYMGEAPMASYDESEDGLPADAVMNMSPEDLATMAQKYDMPHIFDHQVIGNLAGNTYDTIDQVRQYMPDMETGVDRYARILFLLRYRPADFEEAYGKDELMEMEQELTSLFTMAGKTLLRMLKRFDTDKFSPQSDS